MHEIDIEFRVLGVLLATVVFPTPKGRRPIVTASARSP
jgi:hypothetical protein